MSYIIRSLAFNVSKLSSSSLRFRNDLLLRSKPSIACLPSCSIQTRVRRNENAAVDQRIEQLDNDARKLGRLSYNDVRTVFEIIKAKRSASVTQSLMIIRCCGSLLIEEPPEKRTKLVQEMWQTLESLGVNLDIGHYNALLRVYLENEYDFTPSDVLADLEKRGLEPNRVTYQRLITRYCQKGDITGAMRILEFMREKEMPVNATVFNALIMGHSQSKDMVSAEGILNVMKQANLEPTGESYALLISGYIKEGNIEKAKDILQNCEARDTVFTDKEYFDIIFSLAKHGFENEVDQLLPKLRRVPGYNQEAMNSIFRLLSIGATETSFKILQTLVRSTRSDGSVLPVGSFFISHLIRSNFPPETILKYCQELMKKNLNQYALNVALENSLRYQKEGIAIFLLKNAKESGMIIRPHFFWPLLTLHGKKNDKAGIFNVLFMMQKDFDLPVNTETIREFVVPYLLNKDCNIESLLMDLKASGCSVASGVSSVVHHYLLSNEIQKAASVAETYNSFYAPFVFRRPLVNAFISSGDIQSYIKLVRAVCAGVHWRATADSEKVEDDEDQAVPDYRITCGQIIIDAIKELMKDLQFIPKLQSILMEMSSQGLGLTSKDAQYIQQILQNQLTPKISELLEKSTSEEFAVPPSKSKSARISMAFLDENSLERLLETMKGNEEPLASVQKQLYLVYARNKNLEKLLKLKEEMDAENFVYTSGMKAVLMNVYVEEKKLDEALQLYDATVQEVPEFNLHPTKLLRFALLLVESDKIEKALEILNKKSEAESKESTEDLNFMRSSICWRILNVFAEKGDVDRVNEFFNLFIDRELAEVNNILLGPLIKVHVTRGDMDAAMKTFEMCCERYKCTPWKNELARYFIDKEDAANLQKLTDLSTPIHGEVNSLYDLMLSFLESGRIRQAKKILETPGLRLRHDRIHNACNKYSNEGAIEHLENLLLVTKDISSVNRSELYYSMLRVQEQSADPQKALGLWMQMQEEDVQPSEQFLCLLADILKRHNIEVPFTVPNVKRSDNDSQLQRDKIRVSRNSQILRKYLNENNIDQAIEVKQKIGGDKFNKTDWSLLIAGCCHQNRYKDALQLLEEFYKRTNEFPHPKHFKAVLRKSADNGDIEFFNFWKDRVPEDLRKMTVFETNRVKAHMNADKIDDYLNELEEKLDQVKIGDDFRTYENLFPKGGLLALLDRRPEYLPKVQAISMKCEEKGFQSSMMNNFWWVYLMQTNQVDAAKELWNEKIKSDSKPVVFGSLTNYIQRKNDPELGRAFVDMIKTKVNASPGLLGVAYGTLISVLTQRSEINEALECLKEAVEKFQVPPSLIIKSSLVLLKSACDARNIPFPYEIPTSSERYLRKQENNADSDSD